MNYAANAGRAHEVVAQITSTDGTATAVAGDVADEHAMADLFDLTEQTFGGIDVGRQCGRADVACATGRHGSQRPREMHRINIRGPFAE